MKYEENEVASIQNRNLECVLNMKHEESMQLLSNTEFYEVY